MRYLLPWVAAVVITAVLTILSHLPHPQKPLCPKGQEAVLVGYGIEAGTHDHLAAFACEDAIEAKL